MCKIGDIIVVDKYKKDGLEIKNHSFIVLSDKDGKIQGLDYNIIGLVMSSFKDDKQKEKKLKYPGNYPVAFEKQNIKDGGNGKDGFVKTEQFFYFNKDKIEFRVIGTIDLEIFNLIILYIEELKIKIDRIVDNL